MKRVTLLLLLIGLLTGLLPVLGAVSVLRQGQLILMTTRENRDAAVYDKIMYNVREMLYAEAGNLETMSSNAQYYLGQICKDGSWSDLMYTGDVATTHLDRLKTMALAYTDNKSSMYGDAALHVAIVDALAYWYIQEPDHSNWFYDQIAYPQRIGEILILLRNSKERVPAVLESKTISRMEQVGGAPDQRGSPGTGANKMNIAMHWIYRACLTGDKAVLDKGVQQAFHPLALTVGEGLQPDYSYLQHGQQVYIGGYGWDIVNVATRVALYVADTPYGQGDDNFDNLSLFLRQTYLRVIRGQYFMFNAFGRGISRPNGDNQSGFVTLLKRMKVIDKANSIIYDEAMARLNNSQPASYGVPSAHTHFYRADYTLHSKPSYTFELRTVSTRTLRNENGNGENIKGYFLADGATSIAVKGTEYHAIFPTWDWSMIPGTSTRRGTMITPQQWGTTGTTTFVGGVSDTLHGISVYDQDSNDTRAKKAWFFFEEEIVCLGAGIHTTSGTEEVVTTLNQSLLQGDVITSEKKLIRRYSGNNISLTYVDDLDWILHGDIGYVLPDGGRGGLTTKAQTGTWSSINKEGSEDSVTNDVFGLWLNHGVSPSNARYAYIVVPGIRGEAQMKSYAAKGNIEILKNETTIQAVKHKESGVYGFVFHDAATRFTNDTISIAVSDPCLVMIQSLPSGKLKLNIADPTKTLSQLTVKVLWPGLAGIKETTLRLPTTAESAGKSIVTILN
ncbi:chondroitin AC lyase [Sphingobacterium nematocida]|uniref:Chondroitin AC lyase n=1 Tax=Sphingobacterium nematocida TaxID=1513896 RepID=A0A1T5ENE4_9SPHI|nr:polysaccharide lyase family 8 super-sandwich domain-containing protein [Sphingobacterium nematocida]SKB85501.1 chondroitin AC lyase [Sphingobacterium nematocida]